MCKGKTTSGKACKRKPHDGYCYQHKDQDPGSRKSTPKPVRKSPKPASPKPVRRSPKTKSSSSKTKSAMPPSSKKKPRTVRRGYAPSYLKEIMRKTLERLPTKAYYQIRGWTNVPYSVRSITVVTNKVSTNDDVKRLMAIGQPHRLDPEFDQMFTYYSRLQQWEDADARPKTYIHAEQRADKIHNGKDMLTTNEMLDRLKVEEHTLYRIYVLIETYKADKDVYVDSGLTVSQVDNAPIKFDYEGGMKGRLFQSDPAVKHHGLYGTFVYHKRL